MIDVLLAVGAFFVAVAAVGVHRLPDVYGRLQASAKAGTLGLVAVLFASALHFARQGILATKEILTILFLFLTVPVGAHLIASVAYRLRSPVWGRTVLDDARPHLPRREASDDASPEDGRAGR